MRFDHALEKRNINACYYYYYYLCFNFKNKTNSHDIETVQIMSENFNMVHGKNKLLWRKLKKLWTCSCTKQIVMERKKDTKTCTSTSSSESRISTVCRQGKLFNLGQLGLMVQSTCSSHRHPIFDF